MKSINLDQTEEIMNTRHLQITVTVIIIIALIITWLTSERIFNLLVFSLIVFAILYPLYLVLRANHKLKRK